MQIFASLYFGVLFYMITWPVVLRFYSEDELLFVSDKNEWDIDPDLFCHPYDERDTVIDSEGKIYGLRYNRSRKISEIEYTGKEMSLSEFTDIIKRHVSVLGECCAEKLNISTFREGMRIIEQTNT